jgi:hypothetical protein
MSSPIRRTVYSFLGNANRTRSSRNGATRLPELAMDHFGHAQADPLLVQTRMAQLLSREEHLTAIEAVELCDLNEAKRLQQAIEQGTLTNEDVREAARLAHLRQAFETPAPSVAPVAQSFDRLILNPKARLAHLLSREGQLTAAQAAELSDLQEAQRLQQAIEKGTLADEDVREAARLADLRIAFKQAQPTSASNPFQSNNHASARTQSDTPNLSRANASASDRPHSANHAATANGNRTAGMAGIPQTVHALFGQNLTTVTLRQGNNNTCYLLSALDAILHHPQGERILNLIQINRVPGGYLVKFPGQPNLIHVPEQALDAAHGPSSNRLGIPIIWNAYLRIPGALNAQTYDTTHLALKRMFGDRVYDARQTIDATLAESNQLRGFLTETADIWTTTRLHRDEAGRATGVGAHYFSIRPNANQSMDLANPFNTASPMRQFTDQASLQEEFLPELSRLRLD